MPDVLSVLCMQVSLEMSPVHTIVYCGAHLRAYVNIALDLRDKNLDLGHIQLWCECNLCLYNSNIMQMHKPAKTTSLAHLRKKVPSFCTQYVFFKFLLCQYRRVSPKWAWSPQNLSEMALSIIILLSNA